MKKAEFAGKNEAWGNIEFTVNGEKRGFFIGATENAGRSADEWAEYIVASLRPRLVEFYSEISQPV
jgi:hypothetical protein